MEKETFFFLLKILKTNFLICNHRTVNQSIQSQSPCGLIEEMFYYRTYPFSPSHIGPLSTHRGESNPKFQSREPLVLNSSNCKSDHRGHGQSGPHARIGSIRFFSIKTFFQPLFRYKMLINANSRFSSSSK